MKFTRRYLYFAILTAALLCAVMAVLPRVYAERANNNYAFAANYRDIMFLAQQNGCTEEKIWNRLTDCSVLALTAQEFTCEDIQKFRPMGVEFTTLNGKAAISLPRDFKYTDSLYSYLKIK